MLCTGPNDDDENELVYDYIILFLGEQSGCCVI